MAGAGGKGMGGGKGKGKGGKGTGVSMWSKVKKDIKQLHWQGAAATAGTVWASAAATDSESQADFQELTALFGLKKAEKKVAKDEDKSPKKKAKVILLGGQRSQNMAITLKRFRRDNSSLRGLIEGMDCERELSQDHLEQLLGCVPNKEECGKVRMYKGAYEDLSEAEQWVYTIQDLPQLQDRLQLLSLRLSFQEDLSVLRMRAEEVAKACQEVQTSTRFARVLELVLRLGNALNSRQVSGFRLDSLLKLADVTSTANRSITLLDYLIMDVERKHPELLDWPSDVPSLAKADRSPVCQESSNAVVIRQELSKLTNCVQRAARNAGLDYDSLEGAVAEDPFVSATLQFCVEARQVLCGAEGCLDEAEVASAGLLEYLAEPASAGVAKVLTIIATFQQRYKQRLEQHSGGAMKRVLQRTVSAKQVNGPDDSSAGVRLRAQSEPPKLVAPEPNILDQIRSRRID